MSSLARHFGELVIDHTNSPGTKEVPEGTKLEVPHFQCVHCSANVIINPKRQRERHYCHKCDRYTCDSPGCVQECIPWMRVAEQICATPDDPRISLLRTRDGGLIFDPTLLDRTRIF